MNIIYALVDPRTSLTRYIGKSSVGLKRPRNHMLSSKLSRDRSHKANWIRELLSCGLVYDIVVIEEVSSPELLDEAERRWIAHGRAQGWPLTNLTDGGDGPSEPRPPEVIAKIKEACNRPEAIEKMRIANVGRKQSPEHIEKLRLSRIGRNASDAAKQRMSYAHRSRYALNPRSPETCAKLAAAKLGKARPDVAARNHTPEGQAHTQRIQQMAIGRERPDLAERNRSPEQRAALSKALKGRVFSEETIQRMREAQKRRQERAKLEKEAKIKPPI